MAGYYDSSLILSAILGQNEQGNHSEAWDKETVRLSSILLKPECVVSIRRIGATFGHGPDDNWVKTRLDSLEEYFETITFKFVDDSIEEIVRRDHRLADCRALDALHMATAMYYQPHLDKPLRICSLDKRMRRLAVLLGFEVLPKVIPGHNEKGN